MITKPVTLERRVQREVKLAVLQEEADTHLRRAINMDRYYAKQTGSHLIRYKGGAEDERYREAIRFA